MTFFDAAVFWLLVLSIAMNIGFAFDLRSERRKRQNSTRHHN